MLDSVLDTHNIELRLTQTETKEFHYFITHIVKIEQLISYLMV